jgi:hypothetical protein
MGARHRLGRTGSRPAYCEVCVCGIAYPHECRPKTVAYYTRHESFDFVVVLHTCTE